MSAVKKVALSIFQCTMNDFEHRLIAIRFFGVRLASLCCFQPQNAEKQVIQEQIDTKVSKLRKNHCAVRTKQPVPAVVFKFVIFIK